VSRAEGLRLASGSLIAFLDADDVWLPAKLERQVQVARAHPEYGIITTDAEKFDESGVILPSLKCWYQPTSGYVMERLLSKNWIPPSAALVRRECFELVRTFDVPQPNYGEDWMMWIQIAARYPVCFIDEVLVRNRRHSASMTSHGGEIQLECLLRNLEIMKARVPELSKRPDLVRQIVFPICVHRGRADLMALDLAQARDKLWRAVGYNPYALLAWVLLLATYAPPTVLRALKHALKGFRKTLVERPAATTTSRSVL
jgi:glycosyltransferase involved in cell wall biosynthesis